MVHKQDCSYISSITRLYDYGYTYDKRGNLVKEEEICAPTTQGPRNITIAAYRYDETNKMVSGTNADGEYSNYTYNGLGVRVGTELILNDNTHGYTDFHCRTPSVETGLEGPHGPEVVLSDYVIDYTRLNIDQRVLMEHEVDGYDFRYVYGLDLVNVKVTGEGSDWWGQNIKQCIFSDYVHTDRLGSVVNLSDQYGRVPARIDYDAWGSVTAYDSITVDGGFRILLPEITYAGHQYDDILNQYYAKARMYDADNRRFTAVDPVKGNITDPLSLVQYIYVVNNPLIYVDFLGHKYSLAEGSIAHAVITAYIAFLYPSSINDKVVYGVERNKSQTGRPDIVIRDVNDFYHVYEIKSEEYLSRWNTKKYGYSAWNQLGSYIIALYRNPEENKDTFPNAITARRGTILDWTSHILLPAIYDANKIIEAWTEPSIDGMIFYKIRQKKDTDDVEEESFVNESLQAKVGYFAKVGCEYAPEGDLNLVNVDSYGDLELNNDILAWLSDVQVYNQDGMYQVVFPDGKRFLKAIPIYDYNRVTGTVPILGNKKLLEIYDGTVEGWTLSTSDDAVDTLVPFIPNPNPVQVPNMPPISVPGGPGIAVPA
ncbi:hypothetical protein CE91St41_28730 [Oscillospiraceae bacterium]|nr:hypothetical protein CE91St40_28730 [Oscillospiraceae bacterium]BDF75984.1 hypothetical protein CE91St41_28730 [Oscillospiraceae bacterium]